MIRLWVACMKTFQGSGLNTQGPFQETLSGGKETLSEVKGPFQETLSGVKSLRVYIPKSHQHETLSCFGRRVSLVGLRIFSQT